jgi:ring-1,2-phenylacetyl-CoA epoxidase subunit PaaC
VNAHARYALSLGDDALVLAQRLCEWATLAPAIEEDVAMMNIALDLLGQARCLLSHAGDLEQAGRSDDDLAYLREEREFYNLQLAEIANGDFARTMARQLLFSAYQCELYEALSGSMDEQIAGIAAKARKEADYHRDHAAHWVVRLGDGTEESHRRMADGLAMVWPYAGEMFESCPQFAPLVESRIAVDPAALQSGWWSYLSPVLEEATLVRPEPTFSPTGGRSGIHTEELGYLLAEMQHLHRAHPGAQW